MRLRLTVLGLLTAACIHAASAKDRIAVITPERSPFSFVYARSLERSLEARFRVLDPDLAAAAYSSLRIEDPFNLTLETAKSIGTVIGCDRLVLVKAEVSRRSSSARPTYFEASAFLFFVNARTGHLERFLLATKQSDSATEAEKELTEDTHSVSSAFAGVPARKADPVDKRFELFDPDSKPMRPPMPYRRIKPEYTDAAFLYDIKATVDAEVSIDETGAVKKIEIVRWAGFGLDEAVVDAVNKMNWRHGEQNGKPLPMRVLLRYNFTKIEKEQ